MHKLVVTAIFILAAYVDANTDVKANEPEIRPISEFLMARDREIALARSAAPDRVSKHATVMVLTKTGYKTIIKGSNTFVCLVMRSFGNPTHDGEYMYMPEIIVPECLDENASNTILPVQLFRAELAANMTPPSDIESQVKNGFQSGRFQRTKTVSFSYMMSAGMRFGGGRPGPAHVMIYLPDHYNNDTVGGFPYGERFVIVEGNADQPFVAANIYVIDKAIEPRYE